MTITTSLIYFIVAGLCEIGGGYAVWITLREGRPLGWSLLGALLLVLYGVIPTLQPAPFGRVYAAYGGIFIILSLLWGWSIDDFTPDRYDLFGACLALIGAGIMMYTPR